MFSCEVLGCLLSDELDIALRRIGSGNRFTFTPAGEHRRVIGWVCTHA